MPIEFKILMAVMIGIMIAIPLVFIFVFWLPNYRSIMNRARKIDPTVKTIAEAQYVLQKNIMESVGKNKTEEKNKKEANNKT